MRNPTPLLVQPLCQKATFMLLMCLVCTGNGNTAVAGYSDTGKIDVDNMPDAMRSWLDGYQQAMAQLRNSESKEPSWVGPTVAPVAPLIKTKWGQHEPFNMKCPSNGK